MHFWECQLMAAYHRHAQKDLFGGERREFFRVGRKALLGGIPGQAFLRIPADLKTLQELGGLDHRDRSQFRDR